MEEPIEDLEEVYQMIVEFLSMVVTLHVLKHILECTLAGHKVDIPTTITKDMLAKAQLYLNYVESQKHMLCEVIKTPVLYR
jgi:hypothetical protein